ncbi:ATP-binding protein [Streptomyces sp. NPDC018031]|uniref:ATP-binding protein n=1 Tax=Streptomyces sp. NPDC018031 TaxID=3365033 RepID=UPI0037907235
MLYGRDDEQRRIDHLLAAARDGRSGALVVRGAPGIGKTALLEYAISAATGMRVLRGQGIEAEGELPYAGLHLLLHPALGEAERLPGPQRSALLSAFGLADSDRPGDPLLVGLAVLSLLSELAERGPLLCVVDDTHWLDHGSAEALLFAARRLHAEGIALLLAERDDPGSLPAPGLPELALAGLDDGAAARLLDHKAADLSNAARDRVLSAAWGNPLALLELPAVLTREGGGITGPGPGPVDGGAATTGPAVPGSEVPLGDRLRVVFGGQLVGLPAATRTVLLAAAAEHRGELDVVLRAVATSGAGPTDLAPAERAGLIRVDGRNVVFRHPLVRAAVLQSAPHGDRIAVHRALAEALSGPDQADRRAWQSAAAACAPDEEVAAELAAAAARARARGGPAAAAAAHEAAARFAPDPAWRTEHLVMAAADAAEAGDFAHAGDLAERALPDAADPVLRSRVLQVRAAADFGRGALRDANAHLLAGAESAAGHDSGQALKLLLDAVHIAWFIDDGGVRPRTARQVAALAVPAGSTAAPAAGLLRSLVGIWEGRHVPAEPFPELVRAACRALGDDPRGQVLVAAAMLAGAQDAELYELASNLVAQGREQGRIAWLPPALSYLTAAEFFLGRPRAAVAAATEALHIAQDTNQPQWTGQLQAILAALAAAAGDDERCRALAAEALEGTPAPNIGGARWALGLLALGAGRPEEAVRHLEALAEGPERHLAHSTRSIPDLVEAAVRLGETDRAERAFARLDHWARWAGQPCVDALVSRCRALLDSGESVEKHYRTALGRHALAPRPYEEARTRLLYGEWLRRERRKAEATAQLRGALRIFEDLGAEPWAHRARTELGATGIETPRARPAGPLAQLTPQENQIVRLAADGLQNRAIAAKLFLSPRTVAYHLYKAYPKLGVASRSELSVVLDARQDV